MAVGTTHLQPSKAPLLPVAPVEYGQKYGNDLTNALRLYFNQLDNASTALFGTNGGQYLERPYAFSYDTTTQTLALANTAYPVTYSNVYLQNGIVINGSKVYVAQQGVYAFNATLQLKSTDASSKNVWIWVRRTGVDVGYSTRTVTLSAANQYASVEICFTIDVPTADDYIEIVWGATSTQVVLESSASSAPHPAIPAAIMAVNYVSTLPNTLPTLP